MCLTFIAFSFIQLIQQREKYIKDSYRSFGLPMWFSSEESACQCRRHRFDPWAGKIPWRRKWQPTPVFLPGESHGQRSLGGLQFMGLQSRTTTTDHLETFSIYHFPKSSSTLLLNWSFVVAKLFFEFVCFSLFHLVCWFKWGLFF